MGLEQEQPVTHENQEYSAKVPTWWEQAVAEQREAAKNPEELSEEDIDWLRIIYTASPFDPVG